MKQFFATVRDAIVDHKFYDSEISEKKGGFAYFFKLVGIISILYAVVSGISLLPKIIDGINRFGNRVTASYPADLVVSFKNGQISTNQDGPTLISAPKDSNDEAPAHKNLIVIDVDSESSLEAVRSHDTYILLTEKSLVIESNPREVKIIDFSMMTSDEELQITREVIRVGIDKIAPVIKWLTPLVPVMIAAGIFVGNAALLLYALLAALFVWLLSSLRKRKITYGQAYHLTLYLLTLPIILVSMITLLRMGGLAVPRISYLFTITFVVVALINIRGANLKVETRKS
ncbi:MAG: DUF1189 family protein [bacterium]